METNAIAQLISTTGFPIFMCIIMMKYIQDINNSNKEDTKQIMESINANTLAMTKLCEKIEMMNKERKEKGE